MAIFPKFSFQALQARKMSFTIFKNEKTPFQAIKTRSLKNRKIEFFSKGDNPWFSSKNGHFSNLFFLGTIGQENVFYDILKRKNTFLGYKKKIQKRQKIDIFPKGISHGFWSKNGHFTKIFFLAIQARKISFTIFYNGKASFWTIKTRSSKRRKIDIFQKGLTHGFGPKIAIFPIFFLRHYTPAKCLLRYSRTKKRSSSL